MDHIKKINEIMVSMFNVVLKLEERAIKESVTHNLSIREIHTLDAIGIRGAKTMSQVAWTLNISVSTLTTSINKLVKKEYVERFRIPEDRRIVKIKLTETGIIAVKEHENFHDKMIREAVSELNTDELDNFVSSIENISRFMIMQQYRPIRDKKNYGLKPMEINGKIVPVPLFQGGMGIGVSMHQLSVAVCKEGGVGIISAVEPGYKEKDYESNPYVANKRALKNQLEIALNQVKEIENRGIIGVNIPANRENYEELISTAVEGGAEVIVSGGGLPLLLPTYCKGAKIALIPVVSSARAARIIKTNWKKKHNRIPDGFIFESSMAGGYLGYKESRLETAKDEFFKTILEIKAEIGELPLIVSGGIFDRSDAERAYAYGADGIQLATRFIATKECDGGAKFRQAYLNLQENDVTIIRNPQGMPCRVINNNFIKKIGGQLEAKQEKKALIAALEGDCEKGLFFCGTNGYRLNKTETVADIFAEFI